MTLIELEKAYDSQGESIAELFGKQEEGFFVPLYQRRYTWEEENIQQFFDDVTQGVQELAASDEDGAATFLGTVIVTPLRDAASTVRAGEPKAQPTAVQVVIDGQQRMSTLALVAIQLRSRLERLRGRLRDLQVAEGERGGDEEALKDLDDHCEELLHDLRNLYALKARHGSKPRYKPRIIRAQEDRWTHRGDDATSYRSSVACYISHYIRHKDAKAALAAVKEHTADARVPKNVKMIEESLEAISHAHDSSWRPERSLYGQYPVGSAIATERMQKYVMEGVYTEALDKLISRSTNKAGSLAYHSAAIYQLFLFSYYLLRRCGVNRLKAANEDWGFDMFQALNATGTPLTALETLLPQVMQAEDRAGTAWEESVSKECMEEVDRLFERTKSNVQKNRRTNDLLGAFSLGFDGKKLGNKFSVQRKWLERVYEKELKTLDGKHEWLSNLSQTARFYREAWLMEEVRQPHCIKGLEEHPEGEFASFLVQYLRGASSRMSAAVLARCFGRVGETDAASDEFVAAAKACAAFFTLWRSAHTTSGLDAVYRKFFSGSDAPVKVPRHSWGDRGVPQIKADELREYFVAVLQDRGIWEKDEWVRETEGLLRYTEVKAVCRFVLFVASHDRIGDSCRPGLSTEGTRGSCPLLKLSKWRALDYKTLEHVAPQSPPKGNGWDSKIYSEGLVHDIGNLLLLPTEINAMADNKDWSTKYLYYSHVGLKEARAVQRLRDEAERRGLTLKPKSIRVLQSADHNCAVEPILGVGQNGAWDAVLIRQRSQQIKEVAWERLSRWLVA